MTTRPTRFPLIYQINTRILLGELGPGHGARATLDDLPDAFLDGAAARGFGWIWPLGVWQTGAAGRLAASTPVDLDSYRIDLPDAREEDVRGSPFAITAYDVHPDFGGDAALARLRERLGRRDQRLLLDFVPNHVALDHPWTQTHPEYFIEGSEEDLLREPENYVAVSTPRGRKVLAHGRDPFFPAWKDTLALNYRHGGLREAMIGQLGRVADRCDGVRCDMAMLLEPDVIGQLWGDRVRPRDESAPIEEPFWPSAIARIRQRYPRFLFVAEVYWDLEWRLQQEGFDFTYDKRLYDRMRAGSARLVRDQLAADPSFRDRSLHFLENHDEARAAAAFPPAQHRAAAVLTFLAPGGRLFHEGQLEGRRAHASIQLARRLPERPDEGLRAFYERLLACLRRPEVHEGSWLLQVCRPAEDGDSAWQNVIVSSWDAVAGTLLVVVNFGPVTARCHAALDLPGTSGRALALTDLLSDAGTGPDPTALVDQSLLLELPAWSAQVFQVQPI